MMGTENQLRREIVEEEIAQLMFFMDRHQRWAKSSDESTIAHQHRIVAEMLKDVVNENQTLIEWLKA